MIECEVQSHDAYGTPRELFGEFFGVIADTMREILGDRLVAGDRRGVAEDCWARSIRSSLKASA